MVLKNKIFKGFYYIWVWQPYWLFDLDCLNIISFQHPLKAFHKFGYILMRYLKLSKYESHRSKVKE